jgi:septal ring factor EnvC (AmiA/AmiB activator)
MAMGWLSVLKLVPWGDVIESAPKVAVGAKKLWNSVGKKPVSASDASATSGALAEADTPLAALQTQVLDLQAAVADLHQQMLESSALIGSLAEQNTQLIARVEVNRRRVLALVVAWVVLAVVLAIKLFR